MAKNLHFFFSDFRKPAAAAGFAVGWSKSLLSSPGSNFEMAAKAAAAALDADATDAEDANMIEISISLIHCQRTGILWLKSVCLQKFCLHVLPCKQLLLIKSYFLRLGFRVSLRVRLIVSLSSSCLLLQEKDVEKMWKPSLDMARQT